MTTMQLDTLHLAKGGHDTPDDGLCLLEAVAMFAGEDHTDQPRCVSPVLRTYGIRLNDVLPDDRRQQLKPLIPRLVGTAGDGLDETRSYLALDWLVRTWTPTWLDLAGLTGEAIALRGLRRIVDPGTAQDAGPVVRRARTASAVAWDAARAAVWDAVRDTSWGAVWDAAWDVAWDVAWDAAWDVARDAVWDVAWGKLRPTVDQLQLSAITLYQSMIQPVSPARVA